MHTLKRILSTSFLFLTVLCFGQSGPLELPADWTGYFKTGEGRLLIIAKDFFFLEDVISKSGFYEKIEQVDARTYKVYAKEFESQINVPSLSISKDGSNWKAVYEQYKPEAIDLTPFDPVASTQGIEKELESLNGLWFCGDSDIPVEIDYNKIRIEKEEFEISDAFQFFYENKSTKYYLLESSFGQELIRQPLVLNEDYFAMRTIVLGYTHCRKNLDWPIMRSSLYGDLPITLVGDWQSEAEGAPSINFSVDYRIQMEGNEYRIEEIGRPDQAGNFNLSYKSGEDKVRWNIAKISGDEFMLTNLDKQEKMVYSRNLEQTDDASSTEEPSEFFMGLLVGVGIALIPIIILLVRLRKRKDNFV